MRPRVVPGDRTRCEGRPAQPHHRASCNEAARRSIAESKRLFDCRGRKHIARQKRVNETRRLRDRKHHATTRSRTTLSNGRNPRKPQTNRTSNKKQNAKKNGRST